MTSRRRSSDEHGETPRVLKILGARNHRRWQELAAGVRNLLSPVAFQRAFPEDVTRWKAAEQAAWLEAALALAPRSVRAAVAVYRETPTAIHAVPAPIRSPLLDMLRAAAAGAEPEDLETVVSTIGALVLDIPRGRRLDAIALARAVADACPVAVPGLLRCLPRVVEESPTERAWNWVASGLALASQNPLAARAYFALQSRTSLRVLRASSTTVALDEVEGRLHRYIQMLSGTPACARATVPFRLRPALEAEEPLGGGVALPATIDQLDTWEDNARLYRVLAALLAARREFGTYADATVLAHLADEERPSALTECFLLADGYRIARRLAAEYPGLAADLQWAARSLLDRWQGSAPGPMLLLDALLAHAIAPTNDADAAQPWLRTAAAIALPCMAPLAKPSATAGDALAIAGLLIALLSVPADLEEVAPPLPASAEFYFGAGEDGPFIGGEEGTGSEAAADADPAGPIPPDVLADLQLRLGELAERMTAAGRPLSAEELRQLIESGLEPEFGQGNDAITPEAGLYITQLLAKMLAKKTTPRQQPARSTLRAAAPPLSTTNGPVFLYDEWDKVIQDYRHAWCALREIDLGDDAGLFFTRTLERYAPLVPEIRRHFQRVRPESWRTLRGLEDGEDFDLNAVIDARAERRARRSPSSKLYTVRARLEREVATLFLLDMSASTDEAAAGAVGEGRRIIEIEKEALVIMAAALEEIGDAYAIYGFSGQGRHNVEFYPIKDMTERLAAGAKGRIGGIQPRCSTRMGTALRHAVRKMRDVRAPNRFLILISDGFPQDLDYGEDRRSHAYGISDTAAALREVEAAAIKPFCITVDIAGHDYLRAMCDPQRYMIIENVEDLPRELPKIYQRIVRAA